MEKLLVAYWGVDCGDFSRDSMLSSIFLFRKNIISGSKIILPERGWVCCPLFLLKYGDYR